MTTALASILFVVVVVSSAAAATDKQKVLNFSDGLDETRDNGFFKFLGDQTASIDGGALQLTPDTENDNYSLYNKSGRIMWRRPVKLWSSSILASFNSYFVINIYRKPEWNPGHGFAFLIAPDLSMPSASDRQWLGLTNASTDGDPSNRLVAIEFDTEKDEFDPDDNHIGLDINSVRSIKSVSPSLEISPEKGTNYSVWVDYNGELKLMEVYMVKEGDSKPSTALLSYNIDLRHYVEKESYFGFAASTGYPEIQLNCVLKWSLEVDVLPGNGAISMWVKIGVPILVFLIIACGPLVYYMDRKRKIKNAAVVEDDAIVKGALKSLPGMPREFSYGDLKQATNNFDERMRLGQGGFGIVYKGVLKNDDGDNHRSNVTAKEIAVKRFSRDNIKSKDDFLAELSIINRLRHKHLVPLLGWCYEKGKLLLVYGFMPNGSLDMHLFDASGPHNLNFELRYKILKGVASALHYLHNEYDKKVVHRDIKSSNIMLDTDFNARLGDFGLARVLENERSSYSEIALGGVAGTIGYVAPECFHTGKATPESDVFGFGAVVLEVVSGRRPGAMIDQLCNLVDWVWMLHREGRILDSVDERLIGEMEIFSDDAKRLLLLGLACSHPISSERPSTQDIIQILARTMPPPQVPHFKPVFMWPSMGIINSSTTTETTLSSIRVSCENY